MRRGGWVAVVVAIGMMGCPSLPPFAAGDGGVDVATGDTGVDAGSDAAGDSGVDVVVDGGVDVVTDAGIDAPMDASMDVATDTVVDVVIDTGVDVGMDTGVDVVIDTGMDVVTDTGVDVVTDTRVDVPTDSGADVPTDSGPACGTGLTSCSGVCTSLSSNVNNCGACGVVCTAGYTCSGGTCTPPPSCAGTSPPGCGFVAIPGGTYMMGGDSVAISDTPAQSSITVNGFTMDAYEVTVGRFRRFWNASHPAPTTDPIVYPGGSTPWGGAVTVPATTLNCTWSTGAGSLESMPINCLDWYTAQAFCVWDGGRLPTEAEWEFAARGWTAGGTLSPERIYPWGAPDPSTSCDRAQWGSCSGFGGLPMQQVGNFASTGGLYDLAGNVWEWTADWYAPSNDPMCWNGASRTNPVCNNTASGVRTFRGGSWGDDGVVANLHAATRNYPGCCTQYNNLGFRCARTSNCGGIGQPCCGGTSGTCTAVGSTCSTGTCGCPAGTTNCGGACTNLATDATNCGECGLACSTGVAGITCQSGRCTCPTGMAYITGGTFTMGATDLYEMTSDTAPHTVMLSQYCIDYTEVTVSAFAACPMAVCSTPATTSYCNWGMPGRDDHPINCVTWAQAQAYCQWVHGGGGNLPTEAQWEFAAGGSEDSGTGTDLYYPWGLTAPANQLCWSGGTGGMLSSTCAVMSYPIGANMLYDMAGNVGEWVRDCYAPYAGGAAIDPDIEPGSTCASRVFRGGYWDDGASDAVDVRAAHRRNNDPTDVDNYAGFRCALGH